MIPEPRPSWLSLTQLNGSRDLLAEHLAHLYMDIKQSLIETGYGWEIDWQENLKTEPINETTFIREMAWVIISSGMREFIVRKKFPKISEAFFNWKSAQVIYSNSQSCFKKAVSIFNNAHKINAIIKACEILMQKGLDKIMNELHEIGPSSLKVFPFVGPVTCFHLAKNLGVSTAKPDRHLSRIASLVGYFDPIDFCRDLSKITGDDISVIDIVFWRYATINTNYLHQISDRKTGRRF